MAHHHRIMRFILRKKILIPALSLLGAGLYLFFAFRGLGIWMTVSDTPPPRLDIICTFAGDSHRVTYSKELMQKYIHAHWLLSDYKNGYARLLRKSNYPMNRVTVIDTSSNTLSEMNACRTWIDSLLKTSLTTSTSLHVGFVSSPYHMRRISLMAKRKIKGAAVTYYLLPVPKERYNWTEKSFRYWWRSRQITSIVLMELVKTVYFYLTGYLR